MDVDGQVVLDAFRRMFPLEYRVATLTVLVDAQAARLSELEPLAATGQGST